MSKAEEKFIEQLNKEHEIILGFQEYEKKIADLEAKLAEYEKELMDNEKCFTEKDVEGLIKDREETIKFLKQQLAEKEKELHYKTAECVKWKTDYENCSELEKLMTKEHQYCLDNWRACEKDKTEFAIEKLERVKEYFCEEDEDGDGIKTGDWTITKDACEVAEYIDQIIAEIKGEIK